MIDMWAVLLQKQSSAFLQSVITGVAVGFIYDLFRVVRVIWNSGRIKMFFEDVLFCAVAGVMFCVFAFNANLGAVRLFMFIGILVGFFSYRFSLGLVTVPAVRYVKAIISSPLKKFSYRIARAFICFYAIIRTRVFIIVMQRSVKRGFC